MKIRSPLLAHRRRLGRGPRDEDFLLILKDSVFVKTKKTKFEPRTFSVGSDRSTN